MDTHYELMTVENAFDMVDAAYFHVSTEAFDIHPLGVLPNNGALTILAKAYECIGTSKSVVVRGSNILIQA